MVPMVYFSTLLIHLYRCRTCNTLLDFRSATTGPKTSAKLPAAVGASVALAANTGDDVSTQDCPADVTVLGRSSWTFLHTLAATYPDNPTKEQQAEMKTFMGIFSKVYPCWFCADDFKKWMGKNEIDTSSKDGFGMWMCLAHNHVNKKLGKNEFDCSKWKYRWKDGWPDGRCE